MVYKTHKKSYILGDPEIQEKTEKVIQREKIKEKLKPYMEKMRNKKVLINTGGVKSWSMVYRI